MPITRLKIHKACIALKGEIEAGKYPDTGICGALSPHLSRLAGEYISSERVGTALYAHFRAWPEYSGNTAFPVPAPDGYEPEHPAQDTPAEGAYLDMNSEERPAWFWGVHSDYGRARRRLLDFLIAETGPNFARRT